MVPPRLIPKESSVNRPTVPLARKAVLLWSSGLVLALGLAGTWGLSSGGVGQTLGLDGAVQTAATQGNGPGGGNNGKGGGNSGGGSTPAGKSLLVDEVVTGTVVPGVPAKVTVSVVNTNKQAVILTGIETSLVVTAATGRTCAAGSFTLDPVTDLDLRLEKNGAPEDKDRTTVDLWLELNETGLNQDGCKGAGLAFTYTATARQA